MLTKFVSQLEKMIMSSSPLLNAIRFPVSLLDALRELNNAIGLKKVKKTIVSQIKFVMVNSIRRKDNSGNKNLFDGHFLHMVFSGPPGIGKTSVAKIVAKIWTAMGILSPSQKSPSVPSTKKLDDLTNAILCKEELLPQTEKLKEVANVLKECSLLCKDYSIAKKTRESRTKIEESVQKIEDYVEFKRYQALSNLRDPPPLPPLPSYTYKVYKRQDLIGQYIGETAIKTTKALEKGLGGVILIDEAYELYNSTEREDSFGMECLSTLNQFLSENCNNVIVIFVGYMDLLQQTIFRVQPGLKRRVGWIYEFEKYTAHELRDIFLDQLSRVGGWTMNKTEKLNNFFEKNVDAFPNFGGDTERLVGIIKRLQCEHIFEKIFEENVVHHTDVINFSILEEGFRELQESIKKVEKEDKKSPPGMYL